MKMKVFTFLSAMFLIAFSASAQKTRAEHIDQLAKDPKTAENAAKADVYIDHRKKVIMDTTEKQPAPVQTTEPIIKRKKKKS
jgi:hypothetical protein